MTIALSANALTKIYDVGPTQIRAVDDVSFSVAAGELVALVGPSGSGKTTLLALLAGLLRSDRGSVSIDGQDFSQRSDTTLAQFRRKHIGFTFQANNLLPYLTVLENVEAMLRLNGKLTQAGKGYARELLDRLGLADRLHNLPSQLSGGQQQRVAIARAMVHNPKLVLMDEPTASLDTTRAHQVVKTFADLIHHQQKAGIMVTHDLRMCTYADRVLQMEDGQLGQESAERAGIEVFQ